MLSSLRNRVFQTGNINGDHSTTLLLCSLLLQKNQNPSPLLIRSISSISSINHTSSSSSSSSSSASASSFVVSYLMNSCGLSEDKALSASKKVHFKITSRPDSVLAFLENNGFTKPYISKIITNRPRVLLSNPYKTLKPKVEFFNSIGLSGLDLVKILSKDPDLLKRSLENQLIPTFAFLKTIVHTDENVIVLVKCLSRILKHDPATVLVPNIRFLRDQGVPESNISMLLKIKPSSLLLNAGRFKEIVEEIKGMGFDPLLRQFTRAIHGMTSMSNSTWESKLDVYKRWGWSEDEIQTAFRKQPFCMVASEKKIMAIMDFLVNQMGYNTSLMVKCPEVLLLSLEKRIIPRCLVIEILVSKGLIKKEILITTILRMVEKSFLKKYVIKYEQEVPELLKTYQGQLGMLSRTTDSSDGVGGMNML
ncbi:Mitochodrial transcription termination factor-related [Macleaya cordata]|uniref:Mitochodrial transcription termination factor-related n=1 Tax=Macleaya cordata TaxID=56857 RepID=A0A200QHQ2_MACCD|nr:Mitochodrial transcription termination factor-related [Macleaya cordata]